MNFLDIRRNYPLSPSPAQEIGPSEGRRTSQRALARSGGKVQPCFIAAPLPSSPAFHASQILIEISLMRLNVENCLCLADTFLWPAGASTPSNLR